MWHHATYRGDELIVLGHDPRRNDCMLVRLSGLPMNEQSELRKIAASRSAQESSYLIPVLRRCDTPYGGDWFSYICKKMEQRNSPVFTLPIKEIQDSIDPDQKAIFKGYGKGRRNSGLDNEDLGRAQSGGLEEDVVDFRSQISQEQVPVGTSALEDKMDQLMETISDENRQTQQILMQLMQVIAGDTKKKTTSKTRRPRAVKTNNEVQTEA